MNWASGNNINELYFYFKYVCRHHSVGTSLAKVIQVLRSRKLKTPPDFEQYISAPWKNIGIEDAWLADVEDADWNAVEKPTSLRLATQLYSSQSQGPWEQLFDDVEDNFASHRFSWIPYTLATDQSWSTVASQFSLVVLWMQRYSLSNEDIGWDSYSVSERIVNWSYLIEALRGFPGTDSRKEYLIQVLAYHANRLENNLELRGASTNNHLLNNARALYIAGSIGGDPKRCELACEILEYGAHVMFGPDGFLREGSSHYHVLLCRSYLEVLWFAKKHGDMKTWEALYDSVSSMVHAASFFQARSQFSCIGDISPDFTPQFLLGVTCVGSQLLQIHTSCALPSKPGWHSLLSLSMPSPSVAEQPKVTSFEAAEQSKVTSFEASGYYRISSEPFTLSIFANPLGYVPAWSHAHADVGSFILELQKQLLFVDAGRATYNTDALSRYGRSVRSHNAISVDGYEPCIVHRLNGIEPLLLQPYKHRPPSVRLFQTHDEGRCELIYHGFQRLGSDITISRSFVLSGNAFQLCDTISGVGEHYVETFFHLHPEIRVVSHQNGTVELGVGGSRVAFYTESEDSELTVVADKREVDERSIGGVYSSRYGSIESATTLRFFQRTCLPTINKYMVKVL